MPAEMPAQPVAAQSEFSEDAVIEAVERAKRYVYDGDIMQVVLSQRLSHPYPASPLALYRALRALNPSPYMFYYDLWRHSRPRVGTERQHQLYRRLFLRIEGVEHGRRHH